MILKLRFHLDCLIKFFAILNSTKIHESEIFTRHGFVYRIIDKAEVKMASVYTYSSFIFNKMTATIMVAANLVRDQLK
jgi:hypothetical protein